MYKHCHPKEVPDEERQSYLKLKTTIVVRDLIKFKYLINELIFKLKCYISKLGNGDDAWRIGCTPSSDQPATATAATTTVFCARTTQHH